MVWCARGDPLVSAASRGAHSQSSTITISTCGLVAAVAAAAAAAHAASASARISREKEWATKAM